MRLALIALALLSTACAPDYERMERATVKISVKLGDRTINQGAGVITRHGILTAGHVVDRVPEGGRVVVHLYDGEDVAATVERSVLEREGNLPISDMALLSVPTTSGYPVADIRCEPLRMGQTVHVIGHPQVLEWVTTEGRVSSTRARDERLIGRWVQMDVTAAPGNSGGPIFSGGAVAGILSHGMRLIGVGSQTGHVFAAAGPQICDFLGVA